MCTYNFASFTNLEKYFLHRNVFSCKLMEPSIEEVGDSIEVVKTCIDSTETSSFLQIPSTDFHQLPSTSGYFRKVSTIKCSHKLPWASVPTSVGPGWPLIPGDYIFSANLTIASWSPPLARYDLPPITDLRMAQRKSMDKTLPALHAANMHIIWNEWNDDGKKKSWLLYLWCIIRVNRFNFQQRRWFCCCVTVRDMC